MWGTLKLQSKNPRCISKGRIHWMVFIKSLDLQFYIQGFPALKIYPHKEDLSRATAMDSVTSSCFSWVTAVSWPIPAFLTLPNLFKLCWYNNQLFRNNFTHNNKTTGFGAIYNKAWHMVTRAENYAAIFTCEPLGKGDNIFSLVTFYLQNRSLILKARFKEIYFMNNWRSLQALVYSKNTFILPFIVIISIGHVQGFVPLVKGSSRGRDTLISVHKFVRVQNSSRLSLDSI